MKGVSWERKTKKALLIVSIYPASVQADKINAWMNFGVKRLLTMHT